MIRLPVRCLIALLVVVATSAAPALAATTATPAVTQSYATDSVLQRGTLVRFSQGTTNKVEAVTAKDAAETGGVVVAANDASVTLSSPSPASRQVFVAPAGRYALLVSNQDGAVAAGDYLAVSALDGVAKKALGTDQTAIGRAVTGFDGKSAVSGQTTLHTTDNKQRSVSIGLITADISFGRNPLQKAASNQLPGVGYLQTAASSVTGKSVDPARVYISLAILLAVAVIVGSILYSGVRSGIVSIGRNPLARQSVTRGLLQVVLVGASIFIIGLIGIYLILKL